MEDPLSQAVRTVAAMNDTRNAPTGARSTVTVRGFARHLVDPDFAVIALSHSVRDEDHDAAIRTMGAVSSVFREDLGGSPLIRSLVIGRTSVTRERSYDETTRAYVDGSWVASVSGRIELDVDSFDEVLAAVLLHPLEIDGISWQLDDDNPAIRAVRRDAVRDARLTAEDYAAGAGMSVGDVLAIADPELLEVGYRPDRLEAAAMPRMSYLSPDESDGYWPELELDRQPVAVHATVEAVFELRGS